MNNKFKDFENVVLEKEQMKSVLGGQEYSCYCYGVDGAWSGDYPSEDSVYSSISRNCGNRGGRCDKMSGVPGHP